MIEVRILLLALPASLRAAVGDVMIRAAREAVDAAGNDVTTMAVVFRLTGSPLKGASEQERAAQMALAQAWYDGDQAAVQDLAKWALVETAMFDTGSIGME